MDTLQVAPAVWMMTTYLAGRLIVGQCVCLASQADLVMMLGQAVEREKTMRCEIACSHMWTVSQLQAGYSSDSPTPGDH